MSARGCVFDVSGGDLEGEWVLDLHEHTLDSRYGLDLYVHKDNHNPIELTLSSQQVDGLHKALTEHIERRDKYR